MRGILRQHGRFSASLALLAALFGASIVAGQQAIRSRTDLVEVYVTATGRNGAGIHDLRGDEFEVFEDGKPRPIAVFSTAVQPLSVAIVLDHSGSTDEDFGTVTRAAREFVARLFKEDRAAVSTLWWDCVPFTSDLLTVQATLANQLPRDAGALPVWFLSKMCRQYVTVALSGEGADELFGGYYTYLADRYARWLRATPYRPVSPDD